jgi:hypothetical protein
MSPPRRGHVAVAGLVAVLLYLAGAGLSGRLSPLARRPLLDGIAGPVRYNWVNPPESLRAGNVPPASGHFTVPLTATGSQVGAFATDDTQAALVLPQGSFRAAAGQRGVAVDITPLEPARLAGAPAGLRVAGNAYRVTASYQPSKQAVAQLAVSTANVTLVYPLLSGPVLSPDSHRILYSADGRSWTRLASTDVAASQQVTAPLQAPGYVEVAIPPPSSASARTQGRGTLLLLAAVLVGVVVAGFLLRPRRAPARGGRGGSHARRRR